MANLDAFYGGLQAGNDMAETQRAQRNRALVGNLAGAAIGGDPQAMAKVAAVDPRAAASLQQTGDGMLRRSRGAAQYVQKALQSGNPAQIAAARRAAKPYLDTLSPGTAYSLDMDPAQELAGIEAFLSQTQYLDPTLSKGTPTDVQSFQMMTSGLTPEDRERARRINLGLEGRASNAGYGFFDIVGADGRPRKGRQNPRTGSLEVYDETTGDFSPIGTSAEGAAISTSAPQRAGQQHFGDFTSLAGEFPGVTMTSGMRTAERNQQVGGTPNSQHLTGTAADYAVPQQLKPAFMSRARQMGYQAIDEGDHIHLQLPRGGRSASAALAVGRRKEDEARAVAQAQSDVELANLPTRLNMETQADIERARGVEQAKTQAERDAQAPKRIKQYEQAIGAAGSVMNSLDNAIKLIGPTTTGWGGARLRSVEGTDAYNLAAEIETIKANLGFDRLQQMRDSSPTGGALGSIAVQELVALQSTIANLDPNQSAEQIKQNLERVKKHYEGWASAVQQALVNERNGSQATPQAAAARTIVRTGTSNGRKVVQYSDGSVEYGN